MTQKVKVKTYWMQRDVMQDLAQNFLLNLVLILAKRAPATLAKEVIILNVQSLHVNSLMTIRVQP